MRSRSLHTEFMRGRILAVLTSDDPLVSSAAREAAALALSDPAALSESAMDALSEALTRSTWRSGRGAAPDEPGSAEGAPPAPARPPDPAS